jgi:hypothetical protein
MDGKQLREKFAYGFLALYILYGIFGIGMTGVLFSFAIGLIVASFNQHIEIIVASTILSGLFWTFFSKRVGKEGFQNGRAIKGATDRVPTGTGQDANSIVKKIAEITQPNVFQPSGVLSSSFAECFQDMNSAQEPNNAGSTTAKPAGTNTPPPASSTPAATNAPTISDTLKNNLPSANATAVKTPPTNTANVPTASSGSANAAPTTATTEITPATNAATTTAGFEDKTTSGMFKLGSIPTDAIGGAHIDIGTTMMNALNSLKPDQVKAMTDDTRKLMETQKSLMGMLSTMKPMIQDGRQMMETFTEMFGNKQ